MTDEIKISETHESKGVVTAVQTFDSTTSEFVAEQKALELAAEKAQLIVFEPLILNDNGVVPTRDSLANLTKVMEDVSLADPKVSFVLQPSFPLYNAKYYPVQVDELKKYAAANHIAYLDHWQAWPDYHKAALKDYLLPDGSAPNDKGFALWAKVMEDYLLGQ